jgi:hypothetical protein
MKWLRIFFLNLAFVCEAAKVGHYKLTDSRGHDLYDLSNSGNHAEVSSIYYPLFITTDRGYFLYNSTYIHFPSNKYKSYPGSSELILGVWHKAIFEGYFFTFLSKQGSLFSLIKIRYTFLSTGFNIELYQDSDVMTSAHITDSSSSNRYIASWKFGVIHAIEVAGGIQIQYYTKYKNIPDIQYTLGLSLSNQENYFMIGSHNHGITGFIYEVYWFDALQGTISDMFSSYIATEIVGYSCYQFPSLLGGCIAEVSDPFALSSNTACSNTCIQTLKSCIGSSEDCIHFLCSSDCITGCYNLGTPTCICQGNCKACYQDSLDNKICSECKSGYYILPINPTYSCVLDCPLEYYGDSSNPMTCRNCGDNCLRCMSYTICTECMTDFYLKESVCVDDCGIRYHPNDNTKECEECPNDCEECIYLNDTLICEVCINGTYDKDGVCVTECGLGFYQDENIKSCVICDASCLECDSALYCRICNIGTYLKEGLCEMDCGIGYYTNVESRGCEACDINCDECDASNICTVCNTSTYFKLGSCVESCGIGYYTNDDARICEDCPIGCDLCNIDPTLTCLECSSGYYIENDQCNECTIFECLSCESEGICSECENGNVLVDVGDTRVCEECGEGMYESEGVCNDCPPLCYSCESLFNCTECIEDVMLDLGSCKCYGEEVCTIFPTVILISYSRISIEFNIPLPLSLSNAHISLTLDQEVLDENSYSVQETIQYLDYIVVLSKTPKADSNLSFNFTSSFRELVSDYTLGSNSFTLDIPPDSSDSDSSTPISQSEYLSRQSTAVSIHSKTQTTVQVSTSCSFTLGFFSPSALWGYLNTIQMLSYLAMLNIELPLILFAFLTGSLDFNPLPNILSYMMPKEGPLPIYRAILIGYDTSQFIYNIGSILFTLFLFLLAYPLLLLVQRLVKPKGKIYNLAGKCIANYRWNVFTRLIIQTYIELELAAVFQIQALKDFSYDWSGILNLVLGSIFLVRFI